ATPSQHGGSDQADRGIPHPEELVDLERRGREGGRGGGKRPRASPVSLSGRSGSGAGGASMSSGPSRSRFPGTEGPADKVTCDAADRAGSDAARDLGEPGEYPFTRGPYKTMYRGRIWTMRMFSGFGTAADTNKRFLYLLEHGQTGLSTAFDMPTLMGYDSD